MRADSPPYLFARWVGRSLREVTALTDLSHAESYLRSIQGIFRISSFGEEEKSSWQFQIL
jgi:hypothetical protein